MRIRVDLSALRQTKWHDYAVRFLFGGLVTALAGIIAKKFGPGIGGLFLAFPAIFPASATLIEKHEKEKKESLGLNGSARGRSAASVDAARDHPWEASGCLSSHWWFGSLYREMEHGSFILFKHLQGIGKLCHGPGRASASPAYSIFLLPHLILVPTLLCIQC